jgi:2,3-bisphosphoglycerate-independent phosphoglycerate mutase
VLFHVVAIGFQPGRSLLEPRTSISAAALAARFPAHTTPGPASWVLNLFKDADHDSMAKACKRSVVLVVLDGWGYRAEREGNAIALAHTPTWDALTARYPRTLLSASGLAVGLPEHQIGNSEVGHLNLGAGRVVMQDLVRIDRAIRDGSFFRNEAFVEACRRAKKSGGTVHLMGLVGKGGVHAMDQHLFALIDLCSQAGVPKIALHALLDGRDTMPRSGLGYVRELLDRASGRAVVASVGGRYYGMDRDKRWDRTEKWYRVAVQGVGPQSTDPLEVIRASYEQNVTDEFVVPTVIVKDATPLAPMRDGDVLICFNYRADRMRQMIRALTEPGFDGFDVSDRPKLHIVTMTSYDRTFEVVVAFPPQSMKNIVAEVVSKAGMTMFKTAETEKYAHVTYFFNGGIETPFKGEDRLLVPSQKVATYDLCPEMSAPGITDVLCDSIETNEHDFTLCNYANGDMVGHTGSLPATITAVETVDRCLERVVKSAERVGARLLITADHGNCEMMIDPETGGPHTAHTTNPVPLIVIDPDGDRALRGGGALCDVGPTVLTMLGVGRPPEMTGVDLREGAHK